MRIRIIPTSTIGTRTDAREIVLDHWRLDPNRYHCNSKAEDSGAKMVA